MHVLKEKLVGFLRNYSSGFFLISVFLSPGFAQNPQDFYHRDSGFFLISVFLSPGFPIPGIKDPRKTEIVGGIAFDLHVVKNLKKIKFNR